MRKLRLKSTCLRGVLFPYLFDSLAVLGFRLWNVVVRLGGGVCVNGGRKKELAGAHGGHSGNQTREQAGLCGDLQGGRSLVVLEGC